MHRWKQPHPQPSFLRKQEPRGCKGNACRPWLPALRSGGNDGEMSAKWKQCQISAHGEQGRKAARPSNHERDAHRRANNSRPSRAAFPAKAGIQSRYKQSARSAYWTPAFAGDTAERARSVGNDCPKTAAQLFQNSHPINHLALKMGDSASQNLRRPNPAYTAPAPGDGRSWNASELKMSGALAGVAMWCGGRGSAPASKSSRRGEGVCDPSRLGR